MRAYDAYGACNPEPHLLNAAMTGKSLSEKTLNFAPEPACLINLDFALIMRDLLAHLPLL